MRPGYFDSSPARARNQIADLMAQFRGDNDVVIPPRSYEIDPDRVPPPVSTPRSNDVDIPSFINPEWTSASWCCLGPMNASWQNEFPYIPARLNPQWVEGPHGGGLRDENVGVDFNSSTTEYLIIGSVAVSPLIHIKSTLRTKI